MLRNYSSRIAVDKDLQKMKIVKAPAGVKNNQPTYATFLF